MGEVTAEIVKQLVVFGHAREVPAWLPFVARLVIVLFGIFLVERFSPGDAGEITSEGYR